jgi:hypothetical protein
VPPIDTSDPEVALDRHIVEFFANHQVDRVPGAPGGRSSGKSHQIIGNGTGDIRFGGRRR